MSGTRTVGSRTAFTIEFYDEENPRKRRSYSFSQTAPLLAAAAGGEGLCPQPPPQPKVFSISTSAAAASDQGKTGGVALLPSALGSTSPFHAPPPLPQAKPRPPYLPR